MKRRVLGLAALLAGSLVASTTTAQAQVSVFVEKGPTVGQIAPDFTLPAVTADAALEGGNFSLWKTRGQVVVLAFFPKVFMSGSDAQFGDFRDRFGELFGEGTQVVGISVDGTADLAEYAAFLRLPFPLLSDAGQAVGKQYGLVLRPGTDTRRAVFVIGKSGEVVYRDVRFNPADRGAMTKLRDAVQAARR